MFSHWSIRRKLLLGISLLLITVLALSVSSFVGVSAFRSLAKSLRLRAPELTKSSVLAQNVSKLNVTHKLYRESLKKQKQRQDFLSELAEWQFEEMMSNAPFKFEFQIYLEKVAFSFKEYSQELAKNRLADEYRQLQVNDDEQNKVEEFATLLETIRQQTKSSFEELHADEFDEGSHRLAANTDAEAFSQKLNDLEELANELSGILRESMHSFADDVRVQYRSWMIINGVIGVLALILLVTLGRLFYAWVFRPLETLVQGSRRVASGDFEHRIQVDTEDEIAELANAMNGMTLSFREIRDDLNRKVQERTKEVVRSEQLASVGFLAAGVAHEINNPLASIALCAESLEGRLADEEFQQDVDDEESSVLREYLKMIQTEAFRCKEITERLLDFSRLGDVEKQQTNLTDLTRRVIGMIKHLGKYKAKEIDFQATDVVFAPVNAQEIKQVILNLLTNALDSLDPGGKVTVSLRMDTKFATLTVRDNGCGMTDEVQKNLFEPFFTRRRDGQGTGLGMSITYRIVNDHGGDIVPHSEGPGKGSTFIVSLPLTSHDEKQSQIHQAA